jgi:hypothetical protein
MDRTEYNGDIFGTNNGVFFKLGVTVEEVRKAMEENKQLKALQAELASTDKVCDSLRQERDDYWKMMENAKKALTF